MNIDDAIIVFNALSQQTRLKLYRLLLEYGVSGAPQGVLSSELNIPHNTISFHLSILESAGLIKSIKKGRQIIYSIKKDGIESIINFLKNNCCIREDENCDLLSNQECEKC